MVASIVMFVTNSRLFQTEPIIKFKSISPMAQDRNDRGVMSKNNTIQGQPTSRIAIVPSQSLKSVDNVVFSTSPTIMNNSSENEIHTTCAKKIKGMNISDSDIQRELNLTNSVLEPDSNFTSLNCTRFTADRGYKYKPVTKEEQDFPLAFGILMYSSAHQVEQLLRTIYRPHNIYCIHVDRKSPAVLHRAMESISGCFDNVFISSRLEKVIYASVSQIHAEMNCQRDVLKRNKKWKYFIYLTGQEFPLKTNLEIVQILTEFHDLNDIDILKRTPLLDVNYKFRIEKGGMHRTGHMKTEPCPIKTIKKGIVHTALSRKFVEFLHTSVIAKRFLEWLIDTHGSDEYFFYSLAYLPEAPGGPGQVNLTHSIKALSRLMVWKHHNATQCNGQYVRNICIFSWRDLAWLVTQPHLFANKFNVQYDSLVLKCLEEIINYRTFHPKPVNITLYQEYVNTRTWLDYGKPQPWLL
ncbi:beta-1,3-galactosyl-O-glycosyl-glycoprotein beta-1,6-N-acetylglucosaminyltransferase-like [Saccoglossus kowalevskii]|uniref:Beta-1,3-galactosyl-O-glycosyl-glycoprotein beta-1,6-N-acetylglucosaminyltransferase-like n=1 Tax=Saccoglossus kowalevskii TaxID=10224 RepID=A0ABM0GZA3_SACKO|nr:PREDICTED: beta-1,3-galactosyl-O-glycosyl-glycoprotein beta-1,6-N-acetylglucosaminyltransferase-like [Saccoglossus kowalevskii]